MPIALLIGKIENRIPRITNVSRPIDYQRMISCAAILACLHAPNRLNPSCDLSYFGNSNPLVSSFTNFVRKGVSFGDCVWRSPAFSLSLLDSLRDRRKAIAIRAAQLPVRSLPVMGKPTLWMDLNDTVLCHEKLASPRI